MRLFALYIFLLFAGNITLAQNFDIKDFNEKFRTAQWLYEYDAIAWWTTDSLQKESEKDWDRLGEEWFCFQEPNKTWHAIYGKYTNNSYDLVFHYIIDSSFQVKKTSLSVDTTLLNTYSRALIHAHKLLKQNIGDTTQIVFNQYIRQHSNQNLQVWLFPAFQSNGYAVFGGEFYYEFDRTGNTLIKKEVYYQGTFQSYKMGEIKEIELKCKDIDKPTLGGIFFVWYYKKYFPKILLKTNKNVSTVFRNNDGSFFWSHSSLE